MNIENGPTTPDGTELEALLVLAVQEPGRRPGFYRKLMESDILAIVPEDVVVTNAQGDEVIRFVQWNRIDGRLAIPFFTSTRTFFDAVPHGARCLVLDGLTFLRLTRGALLHLNPLSHFNVEITPEEVEALLAGGSVRLPKPMTAPANAVIVADVSEPPLAMIEALTVLYCQDAKIKAAYLGLIKGLYEGDQESLLLGLEVDGDPVPLINDTSAVIHDTYRGPFPIDVVEVPPDGSSEMAFQDSQRFFDRRIAALLHAPRVPGNA